MGVAVDVAGSKDEAASQLQGILAELVLTMPSGKRAGSRLAVLGTKDGKNRAHAEIHGAVGHPIGVDQQGECNSGVFTKDTRIFHVTEAYGSDPGAFELKSFFAFAQLRDVLPAEYSAIVPQKGHYARHAGPERAEPHWFPVAVRKLETGELRTESGFHSIVEES